MNRHIHQSKLLSLGLALVVMVIPQLTGRAEDSTIASDRDTAELTVQTRGPIHEAFAQPMEAARQPGPIVPRKPPDPIAESPPAQKPEGDNVQWIAGYWAWDPAKDDFLWVSGFWRVPPAQRVWVGGYWREVEGGWQWVSGFWAPDGQQKVQYLPEPPASLDNGPSVPAPDESSMYVPGDWVYQNSEYVWQPGYWAEGRSDLVWNPAYYCYTPAGYIHVDGFWDFPLEERGCLFAPVAFNQPLWEDSSWRFCPDYVVDTSALVSSLFVAPFCHHYFFGDYYGTAYRGLGFEPWFAYGRAHYDPLFRYYRWANRGNAGWYQGLANTYRGRLNGTLARPPRTLGEQNTILRNQQTVNRQNVRNSVAVNRNNSLQVVRPLRELGTRGGRLGPASSPARAGRAFSPGEASFRVRQNQAPFSRGQQSLRTAPREAGLPGYGNHPVRPGANNQRHYGPGITGQRMLHAVPRLPGTSQGNAIRSAPTRGTWNGATYRRAASQFSGTSRYRGAPAMPRSNAWPGGANFQRPAGMPSYSGGRRATGFPRQAGPSRPPRNPGAYLRPANRTSFRPAAPAPSRSQQRAPAGPAPNRGGHARQRH